jgi:hypothetical protein
MGDEILDGRDAPLSNRAQVVLIASLVAGALAFVGYQVFRASALRTYAPGATFSEGARLAEFASNGVRVIVFMEADSQGQPLLRASLTPIDPGFHLYSKDHDPNRADGVGVATRLELLPNPSVRAVGHPFTDVAAQTHRVSPLNIKVEIYPDGPVSLRLPIRFAGGATNISAGIALSYMACKTDGECLLPVERHVVEVRLRPPG